MPKWSGAKLTLLHSWCQIIWHRAQFEIGPGAKLTLLPSWCQIDPTTLWCQVYSGAKLGLVTFLITTIFSVPRTFSANPCILLESWCFFFCPVPAKCSVECKGTTVRVVHKWRLHYLDRTEQKPVREKGNTNGGVQSRYKGLSTYYVSKST